MAYLMRSELINIENNLFLFLITFVDTFHNHKPSFVPILLRYRPNFHSYLKIQLVNKWFSYDAFKICAMRFKRNNIHFRNQKLDIKSEIMISHMGARWNLIH